MRWCLLDFNRVSDDTSLQGKWESVANNTGNLVFMNSLKKIINARALTWNEALKCPEEFDGIVTTSLIWIRENDTLESVNWLLDYYKSKPIVPISIGLQAPSLNYKFRLNSDAVKVLKRVEERAVMGVRGEYTAEILKAHGINNIQIIGCPSVYYNLKGFKVRKKRLTQIKMLSSLYAATGNYCFKSRSEQEFFQYINKYSSALIQQTLSDEELIKRFFNDFSNKKLFFNIDEWMNFVKGYDFSFGARFHGNVISVISGVPALFVLIDSRTEELCRYFKFPSIRIERFNPGFPVSRYYDLADYSEFNSVYPQKLKNFRNFCKKNQIQCY